MSSQSQDAVPDSEQTNLLQNVTRKYDQETATENQTTHVPKGTPFPWRPVLAIYCLCAVQPLVFELIFPFINQMILEIGVVHDPERVGFYSGLIESIFSCMSFLCIIPCTYISNHSGRKPVILISISGLAISVALFGMSKAYWFMILTRLIGGGGGGCWATMKVMLAELTDRSNQASAFIGLSISYRVGQTIGQPIGGLLAHPERRSPYFDTPFWHEYPFALPCFVAAAIAIFFIIIAYFTIEETLPTKRRQRGLDEHLQIGASDNISSSSSSHVDAPTITAQVESARRNESVSKTSWSTVLKPRTISILLSIAAMFYTVEAMFALYPLFAFTPIQSGGLGLNEAAIGSHMAFRAFTGIFLMFTFNPIHRRFGTIRTYQLAMFLWPVTILFLPVLNMLARNGKENSGLFLVILTLFFMIWSMGCLCLPAQAVMVSESAETAESLATLVSISQMTIALTQAIAPASITSLFAFSIGHRVASGNLIWIVLWLISSCAASHCLKLTESTNDWRNDRQDQESDAGD